MPIVQSTVFHFNIFTPLKELFFFLVGFFDYCHRYIHHQHIMHKTRNSYGLKDIDFITSCKISHSEKIEEVFNLDDVFLKKFPSLSFCLL